MNLWVSVCSLGEFLITGWFLGKSWLVVNGLFKKNPKNINFVFQMYKPLAETSCKFIDTLEDLVALNEKLAGTTEFAVDLEVWMRTNSIK